MDSRADGRVAVRKFRRAQRACEGAARGVGAPASDRAGVWGESLTLGGHGMHTRCLRFVVSAALACLVLGFSTVSTRAHHSFAAEYDSKAPLTLTGIVTKIEWTNPHAYIYIDVKDDAGKIVNWAFEGYPPNTLKRTGFSRDIVKPVPRSPSPGGTPGTVRIVRPAVRSRCRTARRSFWDLRRLSDSAK